MFDYKYLPENDININKDIIFRKEFQIFKKEIEQQKFLDEYEDEQKEKNIIPRFILHNDKVSYLELRSYQLFVRNYINPNTPYSRLLIKYQTGLGKTLAAISIALNFINYYQKHEESVGSTLGSVFVIGFTKKIFQDELIRYPELGFLSRKELELLKKFKNKMTQGEAFDIEGYKKMLMLIKRRFSNRKGNGFFKFIGYKELFNHLFIIKKNININLPVLTEEEIFDHIKKGNIIVNKDLIESFRNSLVICDEIHNVYNSINKNNWGVAIQMVLNHFDSTRAVFLSATPINNSPVEVIDLLNILLPRHLYPALNKQDFFTKDKELKRGKENELSILFAGRVSFLQDKTTKELPSKSFIGESIKDIDFLKFIRCHMNSFIYNTYKASQGLLGQDSSALSDLVVPNPEFKDPYRNIGLFHAKDLRAKYYDTKDSTRLGLYYDDKNDVLKGNIFKSATLGNISVKYKNMLDTLLDSIKKKNGKIFIYHNNIHLSGTLLIEEILQQNNIIGEFDMSNSDTLCSICSRKRRDHLPEELDGSLFQTIEHKKNIHFYEPVRYVIVHSQIDKNIVTNSLEKFNAINNIEGNKFMILIGSRIIKESHSINSVRNLYIMSRPDNISALIQIIGRVIRLNSHKLLAPEKRHVDIRVFVTSLPKNVKGLSSEEEKYKEKIEAFKVIQKIDRIINENAIDAYFNYETIWGNNARDVTKSNYTQKLKTEPLGILPYWVDFKFKPHELNLSTFNAYYNKSFVNIIMYIIKRLFLEISPVWTYADLFNAVKLPPFTVQINTTIIDTQSFNIALDNILFSESDLVIGNRAVNITLIDKLYDSNDKILIKQIEGYSTKVMKYVITNAGTIYTMVPLLNNEPLLEPESPYRDMAVEKTRMVDISDYMQSFESQDYETKKKMFIEKWQDTPLTYLEPAIHDFGIKFHKQFIEDVITYVFNVWTSPDQNKQKYHDFYLKMLCYYDIHKIVIWAHIIDEELSKKYKKYTIPTTFTIDDIENDLRVDLEKNGLSAENVSSINDSALVNMFISTLNQSGVKWISNEIQNVYGKMSDQIDKLFQGIYKKSDKITKAPANLLPIGHFLADSPRFYIPNQWTIENLYYKEVSKIKENSIIIGFDSRSKSGLDVKFKLRKPKHLMSKTRDSRLLEKGMTCSSKSQEYLEDICKKLNISIEEKNNTKLLCQKIRTTLIYKELQERIKKSGVRYFYFIYEIQL